MEARIIFKDGTELEAEQNGSCFIVDEKPEFPEDLSEVTIETEEGTNVMHDVSIQECYSVDGRYWFGFFTEPELEKTLRQLQEDNEMLTECILEMSEILYA